MKSTLQSLSLPFLGLALMGMLAPSARADFTATGTFQYVDRTITFNNGFTGAEPSLPVRQALVQVLNNSTGAVLASGATDENGDFSVFVSGTGSKNIVVRCQARTEIFGSKNMRVTTTGGTTYSVSSALFSGWNMSSNLNTGTVTAGKITSGLYQANPFNMLDMMVAGIQYIKASGGGNPNQNVRMNWPAGSGSYASGANAYMADDDGYDDAVQLHEFGHVVHNLYSDSDSPGGSHSFSQSDQDPRLAFGEGWASFFAGAVRQHQGLFNPGFYMDADGKGGTGSSTIQLRMRFEDGFPYGGSTGGEADEGSVFCTLWDTVDTVATNDGNSTDDDAMDGSSTYAGKTGDEAMWSVFTGPAKSASNVNIRNMWNGWFTPQDHGGLADMTAVFTGWKMRFFPDSLEPNNSIATASPITPSPSYKGIYTLYFPTSPAGAPGDGDSDYYSFFLESGATFDVETRYPGGKPDAQTYIDPIVQVYRPNGTQLAQDDNGGTGRNAKLEDLVANVSGTWTVRVFSNHSYRKTGSYELRVQSTGTPPGGGLPSISSVLPSSIESVVINGPGTVTLKGQNFTGATSVLVDGVTLTVFPPLFTVHDNSTITFGMPHASQLGSIAIDVNTPSGTASTTINVVENASPTVDVHGSDPGQLIQAFGLRITVGSQVGDILVVEASPELIPTPLPGIADFAIGNNFTSLFLLGVPVIPPSGNTTFVIPMAGLLPGQKFYVQAAGLLQSTGFALPATMSNVQSATIFF